MSISLFNPFSLKKVVEYSEKVADLQEVVYYAESRFSCILDDLRLLEVDRRYWTQKLLHRELVCTLGYGNYYQ